MRTSTFGWRAHLAAHQRQMRLAVDRADVGNGLEGAELGFEAAFAAPLDQLFGLQAVADQARDGNHLQPVLLAELGQLRHARHGAVVVHDFADHAAGLEARHARQIDGRLGLARAHQHAALARAQRKHVAGTRQIRRLRVGPHGDPNGVRAVGRGNAGGDALRPRRSIRRTPCRSATCSWAETSGRCSASQRSGVSARQIRPRPCVAMKLMASGVMHSAAMVRSPSFSRSSSSTTTSMRPARSSSIASGMVANGITF